MLTYKKYLPIIIITLLVNCSYYRPSIVEVVVPYVNDSGTTKTMNIWVRYETTRPTTEWELFIGATSRPDPFDPSGQEESNIWGPIYGRGSVSGDSNSSRGLFRHDFVGESMFNIPIPGIVAGRRAGVIRRKIPTEVHESSDYKISKICDPQYDFGGMCQTVETNNTFGPDGTNAGPQGIQNWKRVNLGWQYWNASGVGSPYLPPTITVDMLPPPDPQVCYTYQYRTPGCWFSWPWGTDDCYAWCSGNCHSTGQYCDPVTYSY